MNADNVNKGERSHVTKSAKIGSAESRIREMLELMYGCDGDELLPTSHLVDDLGLDSLDITEFWMTLEEEFVMEETSPSTADSCLALQQVLGYVDKHRKK